MNTHILASAVATFCMISCATLSPDEKQLIANARLIRQRPVSRTDLLTTLRLDPKSGQKSGGGIRMGRMIFTERWQHSSGLAIEAFDSEYVGPLTINPDTIDSMLAGKGPPRKSFNGFTISKGDAEVYRSDKDGEQSAEPNGP